MKRPLMAATILISALAVASPAPAAVTIGSNLLVTPNYQLCFTGPSSEPSSCTYANVTIRAGDTALGGVTSPTDGVITRWRLKTADTTGGATVTANLRVLHGGTGAGTGPSVPVAENTTNVYDAQLPIKAGERIGVDVNGTGGATSAATFINSALLAGSFDLWLAPTLPDGSSRPPDAPFTDYQVLMNADVEPDADGDGAGDETQDGCPGDKSTQGACKAPDTTAPQMTGLVVTPGKFRVDHSAEAARKRKRAPKGTKIAFTLSEPASVSATLERSTKGRKAKGKCKPSAKKGARCTIIKAAGGFNVAGATGSNQKPFSGRLKSANLKTGSYRLTLIATDAAGNKSKPATANFKIVR